MSVAMPQWTDAASKLGRKCRHIAFCMISNRREQLKEMLGTFYHVAKHGYKISVCVVAQPPLTSADQIDCATILRAWGIDLHWMTVTPLGNPYNAIDARRLSYEMGYKWGAEYIMSCDDDFRFSGPSKVYKQDSGQRIADSMEYLDANPPCGIIQQMSFLGGSNHGLTIKYCRSGFLETALGLVFRAEPIPGPYDPRFKFRGAGNDVALCLSFVIRGYYIARSFNNPTRKNASKKIERSSPHKNYDLDYIEQKGMIACVREQFGSVYRYGKPIDLPLRMLHRAAAQLRGGKAWY